MAVPELVVADAPFKAYPGGVIALRCTDWIGGARGTLTTSGDAKASTGEAVIDTQKVAASIWADPNGAFAEAEDTLTIPFAGLPLEIGMTYAMFLSLMIEGDWDPTEPDTTRGSNPLKFAYACQVGFYGDSELFLSESDYEIVWACLRGLDHYYLTSFGSSWCIGDVTADKTEVLHVRAYGRDGTSIAINLDQLVLMPYVRDGATHGGQWRNGDFQAVGGQHNIFGDIGYDPPFTGTGFVDGADGGDDNGKFTWLPYDLSYKDQSGWSGADGGGDYQRKASGASAEYMQRVVPDDFYDLYNTVPTPDEPANNAHCYVATGPLYRAAQTVISDDFSRTVNWPTPTVADSWLGRTPEGYIWEALGESGPFFSDQFAAVNGANGLLHIGGTTAIGGRQATLSDGSALVDGDTLVGAATYMDDLTADIKLGFSDAYGAITDGDTTFLQAAFNVFGNFSSSGFYGVALDLLNQQWWFEDDAGIVHGPVSITWLVPNVYARIKVEIKRYLIRVKVWENGDTEPGWDYEDFRSLAFAGTPDYPYGDDLDEAIRVQGAHSFAVGGGHLAAANQFDIIFDDFVVEYDPYGSREPTWMRFEKGDGTLVDEIEIPSGAQHIVYVGRDDFTEGDVGDDYYLTFRTRVWNPTDAAELQQARLLWAYFRSVHGGIVSMNWSSVLPVDITRVHG